MLLPVILIAFLIWTMIKGTTGKYLNFATVAPIVGGGGTFKGAGASGLF